MPRLTIDGVYKLAENGGPVSEELFRKLGQLLYFPEYEERAVGALGKIVNIESANVLINYFEFSRDDLRQEIIANIVAIWRQIGGMEAYVSMRKVIIESGRSKIKPAAILTLPEIFLNGSYAAERRTILLRISLDEHPSEPRSAAEMALVKLKDNNVIPRLEQSVHGGHNPKIAEVAERILRQLGASSRILTPSLK